MNPDTPRISRYRSGEHLILSDPDTLYRIVSGNLIAYIAQYAAGTPQRRLPGQPFTSGQTLFGFVPSSVCIVVVFQADTEIEESPIDDTCANADELPGLWAALILQAQKDKHLFLKRNLSYDDCLSVGYGTQTIAAGRCIRFDTGKDIFGLCRVIQGTLRDASSDMMFRPDQGWFPVTPHTVLVAPVDTEIITQDFKKITGTIRHSLFHATCRDWMTRRVTALWDDVLIDEEKRIRTWTDQEEEILSHIVKKKGDAIEDVRALEAAFFRIFKYIGMEDRRVPSSVPQKDPYKEPDLTIELTSMAEDCGARVRRVRLAESWWKEDCGPILVFERDGTPLAALPEKPGQYTLYNDTGIRADHHQISTIELEKTGYVVYPAFPDKLLTLTDIAVFLWHSVWKRDIAWLVICAMFIGILATAVPVATGLIFNNAIPYQNYSVLYAILLVLFMSVVSSCIFSIGRTIAIMRLEGRMGSVFEAAVWNRLLRLPPSFFRNYNTGNLMSRAGVVNSIRSLLSGITISVIFSAVFSLFNVILMFAIYPHIAFLAVLLVAGIFFITLVIGYLSIQVREKLIAQDGRLSGLTVQLLSGMAKITAAGAQNRAFLKWERELREKAALDLRINMYGAYSQVFTVLWPGLLTILIFWLAGSLLSAESPEGNLGGFLAFFAASGAFSAAVVSLGESFIMIWNIKPLWDWIKPLLTAESEPLTGFESPKKMSGTVEIRHVSFQYAKGGRPILEDVSMNINPGEFVAIVGPSGSGKSTMLRILLGFETPDSGMVLYDQKDLARLNVRKIRRQIGVVLQNGQLMAGSILKNISGARRVSLDEVWKAAELAGIDADIREMPMEMHTIISEGSGNISGGQKQRILIARAVASGPRILLMDEATSALDNATQSAVMQSLQMMDLTRIVIAHRLSTVRHADRIYVLDKGRVIETGTYDELVHRDGWFSRHAKLQLA
ncbi:MAG: NHLP bacteriocin export ABC transporter permease/ATPase subunit [Methanoregula sp.]|nr:NHLP bacteriocin export ABC transporter permease/ATPase subunit [Methanoregula sp.]